MEDIKQIVDWKQFRKEAHELVDFMADYYEKLETFDVQHSVEPGYLKVFIFLL